MPACVDCWDERNVHVAATQLYEDTDLCLPCRTRREHEAAKMEDESEQPIPTNYEVIDASQEKCGCGKPLGHRGACPGSHRPAMVISKDDIERFNKRIGNHKPEQREKAAKLLKEGESIRKTAKKVGLSKLTVNQVRKEIAPELPKLCACGDKLGHRGWCAKRFKESPARQETMKKMHQAKESAEVFGEWDASLLITLKSGGGVLALNLKADIFAMSRADREFVYSLVDKMQLYKGIGSAPKEHVNIELTPKMARIIWSELTPEQRHQIVDGDDIFESFDDEIRMTCFHRVTLLNKGQKP